MNRRFYAPDGEGADGNYMEIGQYPGKVGGEWFVRFYDANGNMYNVADGYESEADAIWFAHMFRPTWKEKPHEIGTCPECGSADVDDYGYDIVRREMRFNARCTECGCDFTEVFTHETVRKGW